MMPLKTDPICSVLGKAGASYHPFTIPLFGCKISAGFASPADDHLEKNIDINELLIKKPAATFMLRVEGDSMIGAGIHNDDLLIVDRSITPSNGSIVIAVVDGGLTVKRLHKIGGKVRLMPENPQYSAIEILEGDELVIWGCVRHVVHNV
jgi:DNA polymerase V